MIYVAFAGVAFVAFWLGWLCCAMFVRGAELDEEFTPHRIPENRTEPGDRA